MGIYKVLRQKPEAICGQVYSSRKDVCALLSRTQTLPVGYWGFSMNYPYLVYKRFCKTGVKLDLSRKEINKYGKLPAQIDLSLRCNYQGS